MKGLFDDNKRSVLHHAVAYLYENGRYLSALFGIEVVGHLHGFENDNGIASGNGVANSHLHIGDDTRQWCLQGIGGVDRSAGSRGCSGSRSSLGSSAASLDDNLLLLRLRLFLHLYLVILTIDSYVGDVLDNVTDRDLILRPINNILVFFHNACLF